MISSRKTISKPRAGLAAPAAARFGCDGGAAGLRLVRQSGVSWRTALLGTVAAGALSFAIPNPALAGPDACTASGGGTIETCAGNQSNGITNSGGTPDFTAPPVTTLNVNNLTKAITPALGTSGISFISLGDITITSNTGAFGISTTGDGAQGIYGLGTGPVMVTSTGNITTNGLRASGILGVSYGNAGATVSSTGNITVQGPQAAGLAAVSVSNVGGGGAVTVNSTGNISTTGTSKSPNVQNASGIFAYTNGASPVRVTSTGNISTTGAYASGISAESFVYNGVSTGAVTVNSTGNISARGAGSSGIFAVSYHQNLTGGTGALTVSSTGNITANAFGIFASTSLGTGDVTVTSVGNIGSGSTGIYAHTAGLATTVTSIGSITAANAGISAEGASVTVSSTGNITAGASGIRAIGGYGVTVISASNITTTGSNAYGILALDINVGPVSVTSTGNIATAADNSVGIYARSANGAVAVTSNGNIATAGNSASGIVADTNGASPVTVTSTGNIATQGIGASGIYAKSLGGGAVTVASTGNITTTGGGIFAASYGGSVTVTSTGNISTTGLFAFGIGAGGSAATSVMSTGNISTTGDLAFGIYAKSDGAVMVTSNGNISTSGYYAHGIVAVSNHTGVTVASTGQISTTGNYAMGIEAKSFGAGAVTVTSTGNITTTGNGYRFRGRPIGIYAYSAGGAVTVTSTGNISTTGDYAKGIFAGGHSPGAGAVTVTSTGNISTAGKSASGIYTFSAGAGAVTVTSTGNISTQGSGSYGIYAGSAAGAVTVTSTGNITVAGSNASGILTFGNGGPITITINSGTVSGGSGGGAGVTILGGATNTLTNFGTVTALSGLAISGDTGNNTVNNFGIVTGNVILGSGANAFNNQAGGLLNAGATINLGAGNTLTNAGTWSPGGVGVIQTTALTGNLVQTATGILLSDINVAGATSDRVNVSGTANLAGAVRVQVQNPILGPWQQTVLSAVGGTTTNGLSLLASPALQAQLVFPNATDVAVKSSGINFLTPGLNGNQTALGNAFNGAAQTSGLGGQVFNALLNVPASLDGYRFVLNQLSGEAATGTQQATFDAMDQFMGTLLDPFSRGTTSPPGGGVSGYAAEGDASAYAANGRQRTDAERAAYAMFTKAPPTTFEARWTVWAAGFGGSQTTNGNAAVASNGTTSRIAGGAVGADYLISPDTIAGFALAGGGTSFIVANGVGTGRSDLLQAGAYVRHTAGPAYIAAALAYGWQDVTTNRTVTVAGLDQLQAQFNANAFSGRLEGGYRFVSPWMNVGFTPYAAGQFTTFDLPAYAEQAVVGTNNFALAYGAKNVTAPRSELGFRTDKSFALVDTPPGTILTLRGRFAWAHDYDTNRSIGATFQTLPGASFVVNGAAQSPDKALTTAAAEVRWRNGFSLSGTFEGEFSSNSTSYAGKAVARYQW